VVLGARGSAARDAAAFRADVAATVKYLASSRPTAVNLFWGCSACSSTSRRRGEQPVPR
jgi:methylthioribose-1-phosphate isomerase